MSWWWSCMLRALGWLLVNSCLHACLFPDGEWPVPPALLDAASNEPDAGPPAEPCEQPLCGGTCCPEGVTCADGACVLPDLRIHRDLAAQSLLVAYQYFADNSCELHEACVNGSGTRRLLQFEGRVENVGRGDLHAGTPSLDNPNFEYSACHGHFHFLDFTDYRLLALDGSVAAQGHKQSFCLVSMEPVSDNATPAPPGTHPPPDTGDCNVLAAGWADIYGIGTPCQWVDVTDVAEGDYVLQLSVNPIDRLLESTADNNIVRIPVHLGASGSAACEAAPEFCGDTLDQDCDGFPDLWDVDCWGGCIQGDLSCQEVIAVSGNDRCELAHPLTPQGTYEVALAADGAGEPDPRCGGAGPTAYFRLVLPARRAVYLGTLRSELDATLALYREGCDGELLRCEAAACGQDKGHFADILEVGTYLVAVRAQSASASGRLRLSYQTADPGRARVIAAAGEYAGDTRGAGDSVEACDGSPAFADDDVYLLAACPGELSATSCASRGAASVIGVHAGGLASATLACSGESAPAPDCGAAHGASVRTSVAEGLTFLVVEGRAPDRAGSYRLRVEF
jgi:hypothetical protein